MTRDTFIKKVRDLGYDVRALDDGDRNPIFIETSFAIEFNYDIANNAQWYVRVSEHGKEIHVRFDGSRYLDMEEVGLLRLIATYIEEFGVEK